MRRGIGILLPTTLLLLVVGLLPAQAGGFESTSTAVSSTAVSSATARADFNGDSRADLAIGAPRENDAAGVVHVLYGTASGLTASGSQLWSQDSPGIAGVAEPFDQFGWALATGDFNGDGRTDLAVGAYSENDFAGVVQVLYGSPSGLTASGSQLWSQDSPGIAGTAERGDEFGVALAAGDFNGDGRADLGIGAPGENSRGVVQVLYGSPSGLTASGSQLWAQGSSGLGGLAEPGDSFGSALAAGDFNGDSRADLAMSALGENNASGVVQVLYGSPSGLTATGNQLWSQDSPGITGLAAEPNDQFGFAVGAGDFNGDGRADLAIGVRGENDFRGVAQVLYGSASGLTASGSQVWSQDSPGIAGTPQGGDEFGYRLAAGDFNGDSRADLAVSVAEENDGAGVIHVLYGSPSGLTGAGSQLWSQDSPGITGTAEVGDSFGFAVGAGDFNGDGRADLAIGAPGENDLAGVVHVLYGSASGLTASGSQVWSQDSPGIAGVAESTDFFGGALAAG